MNLRWCLSFLQTRHLPSLVEVPPLPLGWKYPPWQPLCGCVDLLKNPCWMNLRWCLSFLQTRHLPPLVEVPPLPLGWKYPPWPIDYCGGHCRFRLPPQMNLIKKNSCLMNLRWWLSFSQTGHLPPLVTVSPLPLCWRYPFWHIYYCGGRYRSSSPPPPHWRLHRTFRHP